MADVFLTYRHFRNDKGAVTAACKVDPETKKMIVGFSCCNPKDVFFNKWKGRTAATGRMETAKLIVEDLPVKTVTDKRSGNEKEVLAISEALVAFMRRWEDHNMGLKSYNGREDRCEFRKWFPVFIEEL